MAKIWYGPGTNAAEQDMANNGQLAHLQAAVVERFSSGHGFQMTVVGRDPGGSPQAVTYWLHPTIPIRFVYDDNVDDYGNEVEAVTLDRTQIETYLQQMDSPRGLVLSHPDEAWVPFRLPGSL